MNDNEILARHFEEHRDHLRAVGFRMLGSTTEADDAVQETWLRLSRVDADDVNNLAGWLTTVLSRVCLDMLRSRGSRREIPLEEPAHPDLPEPRPESAPEHQAVLADSIGVAMLVVLDTLSPAERLAFVLHDLFAVPFEEIAPIVDRSPAATRQLASRARRRVQGANAPERDHHRGRRVVEAFLAASREGRFEDLLALLDPDVVLRADETAVTAATAALAHGAPVLAAEAHGARTIAEAFSGRAREAQVVTVDGRPAAAWAPGGRPRSVFTFTIVGDRIVELGVVADPETIAGLDIVFAATEA
ncbi:sigma-70 family RNA polymerase sigma factor [Rhodococcus olei]|uniref:Sigma-70 family RNA polymerase sigma factor n=1 Tax=Rhodococcus olei TaxID=2161675 RepID=A0ABP8PJI9_9NOCA